VSHAEYVFLHNTKIARSAIAEKNAFKKSRGYGHPVGRFIPMPQMMHTLLGDREVYTNIHFENIETTPFEYRGSRKIDLDQDGKLQIKQGAKLNTDAMRWKETPDEVVGLPAAVEVRRDKLADKRRHFSEDQMKICEQATIGNGKFDKVSLFGLRPKELTELFPTLREYYEWFVVEDNILSRESISKGLDDDVTKCKWIDGIGRHIRLRKRALPLVQLYLTSLMESNFSDYSWRLRNYLLNMIMQSNIDNNYVKNTREDHLPIAVFSKVSPRRALPFLLHVMLVLGKYETELEIKREVTILDSLCRVKLIDEEAKENREILEKAVDTLLLRIIKEIFVLQPLTMKRLDEFITETDELLRGVILNDAIPTKELPPCILTELYASRKDLLEKEWTERRGFQVDAMLMNVNGVDGVPTKDLLMEATKSKTIKWDPLTVMKKSEHQSQLSFDEQQMTIRIGKRAIDSYCSQRGGVIQRGVLIDGVPGAGKTFISQVLGLYAISQGLRVMTTALMHARSIALGGYNIHSLFGFPISKPGNLFRYAEASTFRLVLP
jgi:hypothetical protein